MSVYKADKYRATGKMDAHNQPVHIAPNIKYVAPIGHVIGAAKIAYYVGVAAPIAFTHKRISSAQRFASVGMLLPKLA